MEYSRVGRWCDMSLERQASLGPIGYLIGYVRNLIRTRGSQSTALFWNKWRRTREMLEDHLGDSCSEMWSLGKVVVVRWQKWIDSREFNIQNQLDLRWVGNEGHGRQWSQQSHMSDLHNSIENAAILWENTRRRMGWEEEDYEFIHTSLDFETSLSHSIKLVNQIIRYTGLGVRKVLSWSGDKTWRVTGVLSSTW